MKTPILAAVIVLVPFFILTSYSLYLHAMLILILIVAEYIQNVGFSFKEGPSGQNHSSSDTQNLLKNPFPAKNFPSIEAESCYTYKSC